MEGREDSEGENWSERERGRRHGLTASPGGLKFRQPLSAAVRHRCGPLALESRIPTSRELHSSPCFSLNLLSIIGPVEKKKRRQLYVSQQASQHIYQADLALSALSFLTAMSVGGLILGWALQDRETTAKVLNSEPLKGNCP